MTIAEDTAKQFVVDIHKGMHEAKYSEQEQIQKLGIDADTAIKWSLFEV